MFAAFTVLRHCIAGIEGQTPVTLSQPAQALQYYGTALPPQSSIQLAAI